MDISVVYTEGALAKAAFQSKVNGERVQCSRAVFLITSCQLAYTIRKC